jgi:hypothetical protein
MPLQKAQRSPSNGVTYRQQYVRCGKAHCKTCPPHGPGHGPYWYGFYWHYRQRTTSFYVGKVLPAGVEPVRDAKVLPDPDASPAEPSDAGATDAEEDVGNT